MKNNTNDEICTIIVGVRDKYSPTEKCLDSIVGNTTYPYELICVIGGAPEKVKKQLIQKYGSKVKFIFKDEFLNQPQVRNIGLKETKTKLAVVMDNDVVVRKNWLSAMIECQKDTGAAMVAPIVLEEENVIHTAGNNLYITYKNGKSFGHKALKYHGMVYDDSTNLKREEMDYSELHCQLVDVEVALRLGVYDEHIQEVGECDSGLTWQKAGCKMVFEPTSVVWYMLYHPVQAEDLKVFIWRWHMDNIVKGYEYFEKKWDLDITEHGDFARFLVSYNERVGFLPRLYPCIFTWFLDRLLKKGTSLTKQALRMMGAPWRIIRLRQLGYGSWRRYIH